METEKAKLWVVDLGSWKDYYLVVQLAVVSVLRRDVSSADLKAVSSAVWKVA